MTAAELRPGAVVDRYLVERELGRGGMAVVYLVRHIELGTLHALKLLRNTHPDLVDRAIQEGRMQARLRHPNVVPVTDVVRIGGLPGLVMEFVSGPTLDRLLDGVRLPEDAVDALAEQLFAGVGAAHRAGIVHRDLKPANVLLGQQDGDLCVRVADFGLAKTWDEAMRVAGAKETRTGYTMGTPAYMAPEQHRSARGVDERADLFALGALLYEVVVGAPPFTGTSFVEAYQQAATASYPPVPSRVPEAPARWTRAIHAALSPDPADRPQHIDALRELWFDGAAPPRGAWTALLPRLDTLVQVRADALSSWSDRATGSLGGPAETVGAPPASAPNEARPDAAPRRPGGVGALIVAVVAGGAGLALIVAVGVGLVVGALADGGGPASEGTSGGPEAPVEAQPSDVDLGPTRAPEPAENVAGVRDGGPDVAVVAEAPRSTPPEPRSMAAPAPATAPTAPSEAAGAPSGAADPTPSPAPRSDVATVSLRGARRAWLVGADGARNPLGDVAPGTYRVEVWFDDVRHTEVLALDLAAGDHRQIVCDAGLGICR
jgi:hypothetical protein